MPPTSSPVPRLSSVLSAVFTVHTIASRSPPRHRRTSNQQQGSASTVCHPARLASSSSPPSGGEGKAAIQPWRAIPSRSPSRPSPPCRGASAYWRTPPERGGQRAAISGRRGSSVRFKVSGFFTRLYRSKYQLFIFSVGLSRAKPVHRGNGNYT